MAEVVICDTKGCGVIIKSEQKKECLAECGAVSVVMKIENDKDLCDECSRKLFAKAASVVWNQLKQKRKQKKEIDRNGN